MRGKIRNPKAEIRNPKNSQFAAKERKEHKEHIRCFFSLCSLRSFAADWKLLGFRPSTLRSIREQQKTRSDWSESQIAANFATPATEDGSVFGLRI
jgi:hypothetical protein